MPSHNFSKRRANATTDTIFKQHTSRAFQLAYVRWGGIFCLGFFLPFVFEVSFLEVFFVSKKYHGDIFVTKSYLLRNRANTTNVTIFKQLTTRPFHIAYVWWTSTFFWWVERLKKRDIFGIFEDSHQNITIFGKTLQFVNSWNNKAKTTTNSIFIYIWLRSNQISSFWMNSAFVRDLLRNLKNPKKNLTSGIKNHSKMSTFLGMQYFSKCITICIKMRFRWTVPLQFIINMLSTWITHF